MMIIYGIPNCDSVKKAFTWLKEHHIDYEFHDYKKNGISSVKLTMWTKQIDWNLLLNKKGTTWRKTEIKIQSAITNEKAAIQWLILNTSAIKRPLIESDLKIMAIGFDEIVYKRMLLSTK